MVAWDVGHLNEQVPYTPIPDIAVSDRLPLSSCAFEVIGWAGQVERRQDNNFDFFVRTHLPAAKTRRAIFNAYTERVRTPSESPRHDF